MKQGWQSKIFVFVVFFLLSLPTVISLYKGNITDIESGSNAGTRLPLSGPVGKVTIFRSAVQSFPDINACYSDRFAFRSELLALFRFCKISLLAVNPFPEKVVRGTGAWYFLGDSYSGEVKESKGISSLGESQLNRIIDNIGSIGKDCRQKGIAFYIAVAPNKLSVYGDCLPVIKSDHPTQLEQVKSRMSQTQVTFVDLKSDFDQYRGEKLFYFNDSHWTSFGAFLGCQTLIDRIRQDFPQLEVPSFNDFTLDTTQVTESGDLTGMLLQKIPENKVVMEPKSVSFAVGRQPSLPVPGYYTRNANDYEIRFMNPARPLKVLIFRDSFFIAMVPFLRDSFGETVFIWSSVNRSLIDREKPDLVIWEVVERDLETLEFPNPPE
jgi:hypothetical protein